VQQGDGARPGVRRRREGRAGGAARSPSSSSSSSSSSDPYRSTIVNSPARTYLSGNGVACRFDVSDALLHSKFLLIDGARAVVGSHNWSAGSYFQFDDVTLVVASAPLVTAMKARFDTLWAAGS
jgi:phosphatidylserine/phosphatidylglycerophosphate/cardiolipin synthase-like enzyme